MLHRSRSSTGGAFPSHASAASIMSRSLSPAIGPNSAHGATVSEAGLIATCISPAACTTNGGGEAEFTTVTSTRSRQLSHFSDLPNSNAQCGTHSGAAARGGPTPSAGTTSTRHPRGGGVSSSPNKRRAPLALVGIVGVLMLCVILLTFVHTPRKGLDKMGSTFDKRLPKEGHVGRGFAGQGEQGHRGDESAAISKEKLASNGLSEQSHAVERHHKKATRRRGDPLAVPPLHLYTMDPLVLEHMKSPILSDDEIAEERRVNSAQLQQDDNNVVSAQQVGEANKKNKNGGAHVKNREQGRGVSSGEEPPILIPNPNFKKPSSSEIALGLHNITGERNDEEDINAAFIDYRKLQAKNIQPSDAFVQYIRSHAVYVRLLPTAIPHPGGTIIPSFASSSSNPIPYDDAVSSMRRKLLNANGGNFLAGNMVKNNKQNGFAFKDLPLPPNVRNLHQVRVGRGGGDDGIAVGGERHLPPALLLGGHKQHSPQPEGQHTERGADHAKIEGNIKDTEKGGDGGNVESRLEINIFNNNRRDHNRLDSTALTRLKLFSLKRKSGHTYNATSNEAIVRKMAVMSTFNDNARGDIHAVKSDTKSHVAAPTAGSNECLSSSSPHVFSHGEEVRPLVMMVPVNSGYLDFGLNLLCSIQNVEDDLQARFGAYLSNKTVLARTLLRATPHKSVSSAQENASLEEISNAEDRLLENLLASVEAKNAETLFPRVTNNLFDEEQTAKSPQLPLRPSLTGLLQQRWSHGGDVHRARENGSLSSSATLSSWRGLVFTSMDSDVYGQLKRLDLPVFHDPQIPLVSKEAAAWGHESFHALVCSKLVPVIRVLKSGVDVVFSDADIAFAKPFLPMLRPLSEVSVQFSIGSCHKAIPDNVDLLADALKKFNTGFYYVKSTRKMIRLMERGYSRCANSFLTGDQPALNSILKEDAVVMRSLQRAVKKALRGQAAREEIRVGKDSKVYEQQRGEVGSVVGANCPSSRAWLAHKAVRDALASATGFEGVEADDCVLEPSAGDSESVDLVGVDGGLPVYSKEVLANVSYRYGFFDGCLFANGCTFFKGLCRASVYDAKYDSETITSETKVISIIQTITDRLPNPDEGAVRPLSARTYFSDHALLESYSGVPFHLRDAYPRSEPIFVHANFLVGKKEKIQHFRKYGMWHEECIARYKARL